MEIIKRASLVAALVLSFSAFVFGQTSNQGAWRTPDAVNQTIGVAQFRNGTANVKTSKVKGNSAIFITYIGCNNCSVPYIVSQKFNDGFVVNSTNIRDNSWFNYRIENSDIVNKDKTIQISTAAEI